MKPEPLTKKEIQEEWENFWWYNYPEIVELFERKLDQKTLDIVKIVCEKIIRKRLKWLLKEIEKEKKNTNKILDKKDCVGSCRFFQAGFRDGLQFVERLIKKAFSGVIEK